MRDQAARLVNEEGRRLPSTPMEEQASDLSF
jgi:hypothetical protein